ncbi:MAG: TonB-dependent receptor [Gammaproteobacteria bacterium]|nr:MAG: TonB-dependent receptor [Gammaproteobacteria bacterium]
MKQTKKTLAVAISAILATSVSTVSFADEADDAAEQTSGLETIVITASKRSENLQESGISVTALSETELERMGANTLLDFAVKVPNLGMAYESDGRFDSSSPSIRGVFGTNTTGFYIDDTPVNASMLPRVMDIERIEVLRGPQGSLYGAKSMGGTIRLITVQPDLSQFEGEIHATASSVTEGDTNSSFDATINLPIVEDFLAVRVTGYYGQNSGIFDREYQSTWVEGGSGAIRDNTAPAFDRVENVDDEEFSGGQIAATFAITDNLTFVPKYIFQKVEADGMPFADADPEAMTRMRFFDADEPGQDEWSIISGAFDWETDVGTLVSVTSQYERKTDEYEEEHTFLHWLFNNVIEIPIDPLYATLNTIEDYESFVHETRFTTSFDGNFNFTVGVFYSDSEWDHEYPRAVQTGLADAIDDFTGAPGLGQDCVDGFCLSDDDLIFATQTLTKTKETAVFGEFTYDFNDVYSITAGGRFYETEVNASNWADGFANSGYSSYENSQSESGFNPKVLVQAKVDEDVNVYATASKGFRTGGINGNLPLGLCGEELDSRGIVPSEVESYDSDSLWSYEAGIKSSLADNTVTLNGAVYFIQWSDIQQQNRLACGFQYVANAGEAESTGFELELAAAPMEGLNLSLGIGYTNAEITESGGIDTVHVGDKIQGVPDWTSNASAQYIHEVMDSWEMMYRIDANYYGDSFSSNNGEPRPRDSWAAANLRVGLFNPTWEFTVFVDNVTDERVNLADSRSIAAETPGRPRLVVNRPMTVGLDVRMRF